jgi:hypothetical protein
MIMTTADHAISRRRLTQKERTLMKHIPLLSRSGAPSITSTSTPVPASDRVHRLSLPVVRPTQATVVLNPDTKAVFRDGQLRIVWAGNEVVGATSLPGNWELDPQQAQKKGLCKIEYTAEQPLTQLSSIVTEVDDLIILAAQDPRTKRMAERIRRMLVEAAGGEVALATEKQ